ncbi:MAG: flavin-dependent oxidoreductase, F420-dependent methylene-tetrahydromethanopterin reductase [Actinomycetia bacterium]|nr:flavin-dependent oxidoreductase, F420-dependent methylene-tetrahydromethanopterin reductase [Actinomycetes bacterium]
MRQDFRAPAFGAASARDIYTAALEMFRWADKKGFDFLVLSEHHGVDDGWMPAPLTIAAAALGATERAPVMVSAAILPLHDPVRIAEQIAVIDNAFPGRLMTVVGAGYKVDEFAMAGIDHAARGKILEEYVEVMLKAWSTDEFEWQGRTVRVTPKPATQPHPMLLIGGGVPAAARRAARLRLPMLPMNTDPRVVEAYYDEAKKLGFDQGYVMVPEGPTFLHVTTDPDKAWAEIGEYLLYETSTYASYQTKGQTSTPMVRAETIEELKRAPQIWVGTPEEIAARAAEVPPMGALNFHPLAGGLPPDLAWPSLELFADQVLPRLRPPT